MPIAAAARPCNVSCPLLQRTASERRKARRNVNQRFLTAMMEMGIPSEKVGYLGTTHPCSCTSSLLACRSMPLCMLPCSVLIVASQLARLPLQTPLALCPALAAANMPCCSSVLQLGH